MSAENAWRIAREILATMPTKYLARCPMPPAFRAAVEAETEQVKLAIAKRLDEEADMTPGKEDAGVIRGCANLVRVDFSYDAEEALQAEAEELRGMLAEAREWLRHDGMCAINGGYRYCTCGLNALLSRLEAKGESHD